MKYIFRLLSLCILAVILTACGSAQPVFTGNGPDTPAASTQSSDAYPVPLLATRDPAYPAPEANAVIPNYPPPQDPTLDIKVFQGEIVPFVLTTPLKKGATEVKGTGPKGVPIILADYTFQGEVMGSTVVQEDGTFLFEVQPLQENHRLGIKLAELDNTKWNAMTFTDPRFFGPGFMPMPQDGFYLDTAMVEP